MESDRLLSPALYRTELTPRPDLAALMPSQTALATTTWYPSRDGTMAPDVALRARLALGMLKAAQDLGYRIAVVDGGSDQGWIAEAKSLGVIVVPERLQDIKGAHSMGKSRRQALSVAANLGTRIIGWLEPEKGPYLSHSSAEGAAWQMHSPAAIAAVPVYTGDATIVVPRRADELASYPVQQRFEEITGNLTVMNVMRSYLLSTGVPPAKAEFRVPYLDLWIGPRMMSRDGADYFLNYDGRIGDAQHDRWESIFVPVWQAIADGKAVRGIAADYAHPPSQTALESSMPSYDLKRIEQLNTLTQACARFVEQARQSSS